MKFKRYIKIGWGRYGETPFPVNSVRFAVFERGDDWRSSTPEFWTYLDMPADSYFMKIHTWSKLYQPSRRHGV